MHATAEVPPLGDGAGDRQADQGGVVNAALVKSPVGCRLNGVRPELKHPGGNQSQQHHREQGDVVDSVLGFHPRDERRAPGAVFPSSVHVGRLLLLPDCEVKILDQLIGRQPNSTSSRVYSVVIKNVYNVITYTSVV